LKTKSRIACSILVGGLILAAVTGSTVLTRNTSAAPTTNPQSATPNVSNAQPAEELSAELPILADNIDGQLTYHQVPATIYDGPLTEHQLAEILVDEYPTPPQQFIYVLAPDHQYTVGLDLSAYENRAIPTGGVDYRVWYTHALSDAEMGTITVVLTETYTDASQAVYYGELKFVVDSPSGLSLSCIQPENTNIPKEDNTNIVFNTAAGYSDTAAPQHNAWEIRNGWQFSVTGCRDHVADPADVGIESYFYPDFTPHVAPPDILQQG